MFTKHSSLFSLSLIQYDHLKKTSKKNIEYDTSRTKNISLTKYGKMYLSEGKLTSEEEIKRPNLEVSTLIHITDLHFGSFENNGVDNKEGMENISGIEQDNINAFINAIKEEITNDTFLIVSGDLTSKNETDPFRLIRFYPYKKYNT